MNITSTLKSVDKRPVSGHPGLQGLPSRFPPRTAACKHHTPTQTPARLQTPSQLSHASSRNTLSSSESESEVTQLCPTLCDRIDCSLPGSSVHGIFQAIVLEWAAISFSRGSSRPRDRTRVSCIVDRHFTIWATREESSSQTSQPPLPAHRWNRPFQRVNPPPQDHTAILPHPQATHTSGGRRPLYSPWASSRLHTCPHSWPPAQRSVSWQNQGIQGASGLWTHLSDMSP